MNSPQNSFAPKELIQSASAFKPFKASAGDADQVVLAAAGFSANLQTYLRVLTHRKSH